MEGCVVVASGRSELKPIDAPSPCCSQLAGPCDTRRAVRLVPHNPGLLGASACHRCRSVLAHTRLVVASCVGALRRPIHAATDATQVVPTTSALPLRVSNRKEPFPPPSPIHVLLQDQPHPGFSARIQLVWMSSSGLERPVPRNLAPQFGAMEHPATVAVPTAGEPQRMSPSADKPRKKFTITWKIPECASPCPLPRAPCPVRLAPCALPLAPCPLLLAPCPLPLAPCLCLLLTRPLTVRDVVASVDAIPSTPSASQLQGSALRQNHLFPQVHRQDTAHVADRICTDQRRHLLCPLHCPEVGAVRQPAPVHPCYAAGWPGLRRPWTAVQWVAAHWATRLTRALLAGAAAMRQT